MSKEETKREIINVLDGFSDKALNQLLAFLKDVRVHQPLNHNNDLERILQEDKELLTRLAK